MQYRVDIQSESVKTSAVRSMLDGSSHFTNFAVPRGAIVPVRLKFHLNILNALLATCASEPMSPDATNQ